MSEQFDTIVNYIRDELAHDGDITPDMDLLEEQILDSFSIVQVALFLQEEFEVELEADDLQQENLASVNRMLDLVQRKRAQA
jgi:acyl carrier protein